MDKELLDKLEKRLADGEISEETYKEIKARYEKQEEIETEEPDEELEELEEVEREKDGDEGMKTKRIKLSGASSIEECNCVYFSSSGASKVKGDLRADEANISGATKVQGNADVGELDSSGSLKIMGKTKADKMDLSGASKFMGKVELGKLSSSGSTKFMENLEGKNISVSGAFKAEKSIKAGTFKASGVFEIKGTLKGEEIMLKPGGRSCSIGKISGGDILVESGGGGLFSFGKGGSLKVEEITGDEIYLENTTAKLVKGNSVKIGPGCSIDKLEAKEMKIHESSSVKEKEKL